jgi:FkbM family methyltransferase
MYLRVIFTISKLFYTLNFRGSTRVMNLVFKFLPLVRVKAQHPMGFLWFLDSRESLLTYLTSCERFTTRIISDLVKDLNFVVCIGANRGWYPLLVNKLGPHIKIHAYEPNSLTYLSLEKNIEINHAEVTLHKIGIGLESRVANLFGYIDANDGMATLYPTNWFGIKYERLEQIEMQSIDSELTKWNVPNGVSLLQMDIEGCEFEAVLGGKKFLLEYSPIVICEVNPVLLNGSGRKPSELFEYMQQLGYFIYWINERGGLYTQNAKDPCRHLAVLSIGSGSNYIFLKESHLSNISFKIHD